MAKEIGRVPFVTKCDSYGNETKVMLLFFDDGTVRWEAPPAAPGFPTVPSASHFSPGQ